MIARWPLVYPNSSGLCRFPRQTLCSLVPAENLRHLRVRDLLLLLRYVGLPTTGDRSVLMQRLADNATLKMSVQARHDFASMFELDLEAAAFKAPRAQRAAVLGSALGKMHAEQKLEDLLRSVANERAAGAMSLAQAGALSCIAARLRVEAVEAASSGPVSDTYSHSSAQTGQRRLSKLTRTARVTAGPIEEPPTQNHPVHAQATSALEDAASKRSASILDFNLHKYRIGGIHPAMQDRLKRGLLTRALDESLLQRLGMAHQRGFLLFGPPGCGKTLIALAMAKVLCATSVQYVTAADINNKFFGESDQRMRALFEPARKSKQKCCKSDLHIVIMDEIDALAASRSGSDTRNHESALNVLLACMDGMEENDQTIVFGLTNRKDKVDTALLRPGRLGVHIEVGLPNLQGRLDVLRIHLDSLTGSGLLSPDVSLLSLAERTSSFSGADLRQLVDSALAFSLLRLPANILATGEIDKNLVRQEEIELALEEVQSMQAR